MEIVEQKRLFDHPSLEQVPLRGEKVFGTKEGELLEESSFPG